MSGALPPTGESLLAFWLLGLGSVAGAAGVLWNDPVNGMLSLPFKQIQWIQKNNLFWCKNIEIHA